MALIRLAATVAAFALVAAVTAPAEPVPAPVSWCSSLDAQGGSHAWWTPDSCPVLEA